MLLHLTSSSAAIRAVVFFSLLSMDCNVKLEKKRKTHSSGILTHNLQIGVMATTTPLRQPYLILIGSPSTRWLLGLVGASIAQRHSILVCRGQSPIVLQELIMGECQVSDIII